VLATLAGLGAAFGNYQREQHKQTQRAAAMTGGNADRAPAILTHYGCAACHETPGIRAPGGLAGPPLAGIAERLYVGGVTPNTPDNLVQWIVNPKHFSRDTAMPVTGISKAEARDVAAYLYINK
jgi:cytochrome c2